MHEHNRDKIDCYSRQFDDFGLYYGLTISADGFKDVHGMLTPFLSIFCPEPAHSAIAVMSIQ